MASKSHVSMMGWTMVANSEIEAGIRGASGNEGQSLVDVQLNFVRVQFASEQDEDHVDAEILHS